MPPTSKKLWEHIGFGLSVRVCVRACVRASVRKKKNEHAGDLKFPIWIPHGKIADARFFFLVRVISISGVMPF